jgi:hypothetical protein
MYAFGEVYNQAFRFLEALRVKKVIINQASFYLFFLFFFEAQAQLASANLTELPF